MKDHVRILVCGDEQVGKTTFILTTIVRHFPGTVPHVMAEVNIPPEENDDGVHCTINDSSAHQRDRPQLLAHLKSAESIVLLYDVERLETLHHLDSFWLPLIEANTDNVPVVIVRNKVDKLLADMSMGGRSDEDLRRQMAPLKERYKFFHTSLECSSLTQVGMRQVFHHALTAALYPLAPLYDSKADQLSPLFDRAIRRLFRIYDKDGDGLLGDHELNTFQYESFRLNLSAEDIAVLKRVLTKVALGGAPEMTPSMLVVPASEESAGGMTEEGFVRLMRIFIDKKQLKAPWKALYNHNYDDRLNLLVPPEVMDPPPGPMGGGWHDQVLSPKAEAFLLSLFDQFSSATEASSQERVLTGERQSEIFSVIPDPACPPWCPPRSEVEFEWQEGNYDLFGRLRRAPGGGEALTVEGWMAHWQMLAAHSPVLARAHLFYVGFREEVADMLVTAQAREGGKRRPHGREQRPVLQVFVLGRSGCGRSRLVKGLRLGADLRSRQQSDASSAAAEPGDEAEPEVPETCAAFACSPIADAASHSSPRASHLSQWAERLTSSRFQPITVTEVPEGFTDAFVQEQAWRCELAVLVFDPSSRESFDFVARMQGALPDDVPRIVVACLQPSCTKTPSIVTSAQDMCQELELTSPIFALPESGEGLEGKGGLREKLAEPDGPGMLPHGEQHRRKKRNRAIRRATYVTLTLVTAAVAVATYYKFHPPSGEKSAKSGDGRTGGANPGWEAGVGGALRVPVRAAKRAAAAAVEYWRRWRSAGAEAGYSSRGSGGGREAAYFRQGMSL